MHVLIGNFLSEIHKLDFGVPQGSVLGLVAWMTHTYIYYIPVQDVPSGSISISGVWSWMNKNTLKINEDKTRVLHLFHQRTLNSYLYIHWILDFK